MIDKWKSTLATDENHHNKGQPTTMAKRTIRAVVGGMIEAEQLITHNHNKTKTLKKRGGNTVWRFGSSARRCRKTMTVSIGARLWLPIRVST